MSRWEELCALAGNLASLWNGGREVLAGVSAAIAPGVSPWEALRWLGSEQVDELFATDERRARLHAAFVELSRYLTAETWFDRASRRDPRLATLSGSPVAYFCAEFGLAAWLPIYSGGLGVLAGDVLKESSDMGLPLVGVGLFYRHGFFQQRLDEHRYQRELYTTLDPAHLPLTLSVDSSGHPIDIEVPMGNRRVFTRVWQLQVGRTPLYLLDTDIPENERDEDRAITANLYGGDQDTRIRQEIVLGVGGVRALEALGIHPSLYSMNEGHAALLGLELVTERLGRGEDLSGALAVTRPRIVYTNHTVVPAGNDVFPQPLVEAYLGPYAEQSGLGLERLLALGGGDGLSMAVLAFNFCGRANAVSETHGTVIPQHWPGYTVDVVTNGVHVPTWLGASIRELLDRYVTGWQGGDPDWDRILDLPAQELWQARCVQRREMIDFVNDRQLGVRLDADALTLVWARRFAEYKRPGLISSELERLAKLLADPARPVQIVVSGKAHPRDEAGKQAMQELLTRVSGDQRVAPHVAFVEDYDLEVARHLTAGADVWVNTPQKPLEASGTSGMKSSDNGGLQLTIRDGWAAEVDWWNVGWGIDGADAAADADRLYSFLENDIVPSFFERDERGVPTRWVELMKNTMLITLTRYSARRMLADYLEKLYLPLLGEQGLAEDVSMA